MAYVLVQHLDPTHESYLPEILQRVTKIPVHEITEDIHLAPDHIYIIPANKILTSTDGVLQLAPRDKNKLNLSIDIFFTSLADVHKECAVGIVLSGTGSDGTLGLKAIKEHGGIGIAQDLKSAAYISMPQSAVNAGVVDFVLAPEDIPAQLLQINSSYKANNVFKDDEQVPEDDDKEIFKKILLLLHQRSGVDFTFYKKTTFHRRIARRIAIVNKSNLSEYLTFLRANEDEQDALFQDVLIPVTSFYRDPKIFQKLSDIVFPDLFKNKSSGESIRVWSAGCSTGQEAFSLAICISEFLGDNLAGTKIQIFASDISEKAIRKARTAIYTKVEVEKLSDRLLKKYFTKNNGAYEVNKRIRQMCVFAPHNFLKDPPFAKMDLISCRNVLIYMDAFLQKKAFTTFHYALKDKGVLLLGKSETIGASSDLFSPLVKQDKMYSRKPVPGRFMHVATERREVSLVTKDLPAGQTGKTDTKKVATQTDFRKSAEVIMIATSPASVVVNEQMDIVHIHGDITPFLRSPQGKPTHNLIKMARNGLAFELRNAIHKAKTSEEPIIKENIPVIQNGKQSLVTITITALTNTVDIHYLIQFEEKIMPVVAEDKKSSSTKASAAQKQNVHLVKELSQTREDMRSITEDMEAYNEELQSANEELQSSNEEMQSLNEELETSREELQSTNEELIIVNQELIDKQDQLHAARLYSDSIVSTIRHPLIVLDKNLLVKTANDAFYKTFNVDEKDTEQKWFYEIQHHQFDDFKLRSLLIKVLSQKNRIDDFEIVLKLPMIGERTLLMNAQQIKNERTDEQLILLAIEDKTEQVAAQKIIDENKKRSEKERKLLHDFFTQAPAMLAILKGPEHEFEFANPVFVEFIGNRILIGKTPLEALPEIAGQNFMELLDTVYNTGETYTAKEMPVTMDKGNGKQEEFYSNLTYQAFTDENGKTEGILIFAYDVTEQVTARKQIEESENEQKKLATHLKLATDSANVGVWSLVIDSSKLEWSNIHKNLWGYDAHREDLTYEDWHKVIVPEDKDLALQKIEESKLKHDIYEVDYRIKRPNDETVLWMRSTGQYHYDDLGKAHTLSGISIDITEHKSFTEALEIKVKERTAALKKSNDELKKTNTQLDQFAHVASHDLQEPLRKILTFSMRLQDKYKEELSTEVKTYLNKIEGASGRMKILIQDLLNYSRLLEHEKSVGQTDLNETLKNILNDFELLVHEKKAQIKFDELPTIDAVSLQMNQLFYNLFSNALKFSREEVPPVITITSRTLSEKEIKKYPALNPSIAYFEIIFKDNGIGFEQHYSEKIFTIFQRLHGKETYIGTGIGLALTKKIIENHQGIIFADAKENRGASFHVILPFKQPQ
ncbi:two-component system, chemotaxis family, CheB/CheR fusion protein [Pricia antarctica]|uniref:Two-component system, chemotaxis family, CheB/CheR fusion protein n=2 Tax=Pricia antarctica TaxID=641691 RepID=A0A1G7IU30_9FLAO|nr:two-component system, chemotaxis family, CheB/CheR fusion protein [Pricia antarctica]